MKRIIPALLLAAALSACTTTQLASFQSDLAVATTKITTIPPTAGTAAGSVVGGVLTGGLQIFSGVVDLVMAIAPIL